MLLSTAAFLTAAGFIAWAGGQTAGYPAIAVIGAILVLGVGASVADGGLERQSGVIERENTTANETIKEYQFEQAQLSDQLPLGFLLTLLGGVGTLHALNRTTDGLP